MKATRFIATSTLVLACVFSGAYQTEESKSSVVGGATPEPTQAEKALQKEQEFHTRLSALNTIVDRIAQSLVACRRSTLPQSDIEIKRLERELELADKEVADLSLVGTSGLAVLQREEMETRLGDLHAMLEGLRVRWKQPAPVFGLKAFQSAPTVFNPRAIPANYRLRSGDKITISVFSKLGAERSYRAIVDKKGMIGLIGAGKVVATGKTANQLRAAIQQKVSSQFKQLKVSVVVESYSALQVQVLGEVNRPGSFNLASGSTLSDALRSAGGPTETGSLRLVNLSSVSGTKKVYDLYALLLNGDRRVDVPLSDADIVLVPAVGPTITLNGEVTRPGRYELVKSISLMDALKMAGGAKPTGNAQTVKVDRVENGEFRQLINSKVGAKDSTSFLVQAGDEITVNPIHPDRSNRVSILGPVKTPGVFALREGMRLKDLIDTAEGFLPEAEVYGGRADILRYDPMQGARIVTVNLTKALSGDSANNVILQKYDRVFVYNPEQIVFRSKVITLAGAIARPGVYKRTNGMKVGDAVVAAGGTLPEAFLEKASLIRHLDGDKTEMITIDLTAALSGNPESNIELSDRDELTVFTHSEAQWREKTVRIEGLVQRPGVFKRSENMRLSDLLFLSGGLLPEAATQCQIARVNKDGSTNIITVDLASLKAKGTSDEPIRDLDVVTVPKNNGFERDVAIVYLSGEVARPGPYAINLRKDRISDLIDRAGGLTTLAHVGGALFLRPKEKFQNEVQEREADVLLQKSKILANRQFTAQLAKMGITISTAALEQETGLSKPIDAAPKNLDKDKTKSENQGQATDKTGKGEGAVSDPGKGKGETTGKDGDKTETKDPEKTSSAMGPALKLDLNPALAENKAILAQMIRVSVDLGHALSNKESSDNLLLTGGDKIFIPAQSNIVTIVGAVLHPHRVAAKDKATFDQYIAKSGGFAQDAAPRYAVVIRANGDAYPARSVRHVLPGDMIVVPTTGLVDVTKRIEKVQDVTKVIADVLSSVFILTKL